MPAETPLVPYLVSTIIPVFNRAGLLREAVQSVLDQTYRPIEVIIVDDESTDDTPGCGNATKDEAVLRRLKSRAWVEVQLRDKVR